jgi:hypothetical protein
LKPVTRNPYPVTGNRSGSPPSVPPEGGMRGGRFATGYWLRGTGYFLGATMGMGPVFDPAGFHRTARPLPDCFAL